MGHALLAKLVEYGLMAWLVMLALLLLFRLLTWPSQFAGLLARDPYAARNKGLAPERVQLLAAFVFVLFGYAFHALSAWQVPAGPMKNRPVMPDAPQALLVMLGASHTIYLSGKLGRKIARK